MAHITYFKIRHLLPPPDTYTVNVCFNGEPAEAEAQSMNYNSSLRLFEPEYFIEGSTQNYSYTANAANHLFGIAPADMDSISTGGVKQRCGGGIIKPNGFPSPYKTSLEDTVYENEEVLRSIYLSQLEIRESRDGLFWNISGEILQRNPEFSFHIASADLHIHQSNYRIHVLAVHVLPGKLKKESFAGIQVPKTSLSEDSPCAVILHDQPIDFSRSYKKSGWFYLSS